jgi:hypothetical protein
MRTSPPLRMIAHAPGIPGEEMLAGNIIGCTMLHQSDEQDTSKTDNYFADKQKNV